VIRLAVAVAGAGADEKAFVVWRGFEESIRKAAALGYDGVELALKTAGEVDAAGLKGLLAESGLECPCVSTGQVFSALGLCFTTRSPAQRAEVISVFRGLIDLAAEFGAMVNVGRARGFIGDEESREDAERRFVAVARELCDHAAPKGVKLVLEPVNRYEIDFVNSVADGAALMEKVARPNMALMPDLFHMNIEDASIPGALEAHASRVAYLHFADSNRKAPGEGHTDFEAVMAALGRTGYDGWISVEILPDPDPDTAARRAIERLRPLVEEYNRG